MASQSFFFSFKASCLAVKPHCQRKKIKITLIEVFQPGQARKGSVSSRSGTLPPLAVLRKLHSAASWSRPTKPKAKVTLFLRKESSNPVLQEWIGPLLDQELEQVDESVFRSHSDRRALVLVGRKQSEERKKENTETQSRSFTFTPPASSILMASCSFFSWIN